VSRFGVETRSPPPRVGLQDTPAVDRGGTFLEAASRAGGADRAFGTEGLSDPLGGSTGRGHAGDAGG